MPQRIWTRETARIALRLEAKRLGRTPTLRDLAQPDRVCASAKTYSHLFGSVGRAQEVAGLVRNQRGRIPGTRLAKCHRGHARTPENLDSSGHCRQCAAFWESRKRRGLGATLPRVGLVERRRRDEAIARHNAELAKHWGMAS